MKKKPIITGNHKKIKKLNKKLNKKSFNKSKMSKKKLMKKRQMFDKKLNTRIELLVQEFLVAFNVLLVLGVGGYIGAQLVKGWIVDKGN